MAFAKRVGEYQSGFSTYADRVRFMEAADRVFPEFRNDLRASVLPHMPAGVSIDVIRRTAVPSFFFSAWLQRFHVEQVPWLQCTALRTLRYWKQFPDKVGFELGAVAGFVPEDVIFRWERSIESGTDFLKRVTETVKKISDTYDQKSPVALSEHHAEWLALFQFAGYTARQIQQWETGRGNHIGAGDDLSTIKKGVKAAADRLGIPLRKAPKK